MGQALAFPGTARFEIKRQLGAGGMGVVYEAYDRDRKQTVALKTLKWADAQAIVRFKNEFRALHDISHPNLVSLYELFEDAGEMFFTMEMLRGVDFLSYVRGAKGRPPSNAELSQSEDTLRAEKQMARQHGSGEIEFDEARLRATLPQLAAGVTALHAAGKVHRDIKPSNVMVTESGRVVLLDFGLVTQRASDRQSSNQSVVGTAEYMAPEQALSGEVGSAADWYSVGVVLYEALTSHLPHQGRTALEILMNKQNLPAAPPRQWVASVPQDLDQLCVKLLETVPTKRPATEVILAQLGVAANEGAVGANRPSSVGFTQTTPFVGRRSELEALAAAQKESRKKPVVVLVEGESGLGKSELVREFCDRLRAEVSDTVVLTGRCYERESVAYKAFDGLIDALSRYLVRLPKAEAAALLPMQAGLLPALFPVLRRVEPIAAAPHEAEIIDPQERRRQMYGALRELLARLAKRHPVVLVIDDLQWTDVDSLVLLHEVLADTTAPRLMLVATMRPVSESERKRILEAVSTIDRRHVELAAFSQARARELASILLPTASAAVLDGIAEESAGHPLFVMELARYAQGRQDDKGPNLTLNEALWQRVVTLPEELLRLLELLCVAGVPVTQETAAIAAEMPQSAFSTAVAGLRISYFVRTSGARGSDLIEPYHDRVREIVTSHLGDAPRLHCHRRLVLAFEQTGTAQSAPQAMVRHAEAAGEPVRAAKYAERAADQAVTAMAFDQAAELFQTALRLGTHDENVSRGLRLSIAEALGNASRGPEAAEAFMTAAEGADAATRLDCQRRAVEQWLTSGHIERGMAELSKLLTRMNVSIPTTPRRALVSLLWNRTKLRLRGLSWKPRDVSELGRAVQTRIEFYFAISRGLMMVDLIRGVDFHVRGLLLALNEGDSYRVGVGLVYEAGFSSSEKPHANTRAQLMLTKAKGIDPNDPYLRALTHYQEGVLYYFQSRFRASIAKFVVGEELLGKQAGRAWERSSFRMMYLWSLLRRGTLREASVIHGYLRDARRRGDLYTYTSMIRSCHMVWLAQGDLDQARRMLAEATWAPPDGVFHMQHWFEFRAVREMNLYEGTAAEHWEASLPQFVAVRESLLMRAITIRIDVHWLRGRMAVARALAEVAKAGKEGASDSSRATARLLKEAQRMARRLEREKDPYATASAQLLRAAIAEQRGKRGDAIRWLVAATTTADEGEILLHAASARRRHGELLGGSEGAALIEQADAWMHEQDVVDPARLIEIFVPGF